MTIRLMGTSESQGEDLWSSGLNEGVIINDEAMRIRLMAALSQKEKTCGHQCVKLT